MSSEGPQYPQYPGEDPPERPRPPAPPPPSSSDQSPAAGQAPPPGAPSYGPPTLTNAKATWAMILGIVGTLLCCLFAGVPAIILGYIARKEIAASSGFQQGRGMATAGIVLGILGVVFSVLAMVFFGFVITSSEFQEGFREGYQENTR